MNRTKAMTTNGSALVESNIESNQGLLPLVTYRSFAEAVSCFRAALLQPLRLTMSLAMLALAMLALLPTPALAQTYIWNNADTIGGGGFIPGIIFNPTQQNLIYAR